MGKKLRAEIHPVGLGEVDSVATINVRPEIGGSSLYEDVENVEICSTYEVPIIRFDHLFADFARPALCKIDVQGAELAVLKGMGERLAEIDVLIVETSLIATLKGNAPELAEVMAFFGSHDFCLYDIVGMTRRPLDQALAQIDAVFVPKNSALRRDRRWGQQSRN